MTTSFGEIWNQAHPGNSESISERPVVCIQGLGFVGAAMALAVAHAVDQAGEPRFNVIGLELKSPNGENKVNKLNSAELPFRAEDPMLLEALQWAHRRKNFVASFDTEAYRIADVVVVDIHCDVKDIFTSNPKLDLSGLESSIRLLGQLMKPGSLIIVETTVPPGTCEKVLYPILVEELLRRRLSPEEIGLAHSYERVMPGPKYFDSIRNFWRVYSGVNESSAKSCEKFLCQVINVKDYPLTRLGSPTASETAKVLENSFRAMNIAFMEEWGRFGEAVGIDIFEIVEAIRRRPTHANIRQPGFAVGGYCLTKDPLFAGLAAKELFGREDLKFPFSRLAVETNRQMPLVTLNQLTENMGGSIREKKILLMGVSYLADVSDTRHSGSETFLRAAMVAGAKVELHDPIVEFWDEMQLHVPKKLPDPRDFDAIVITQPHREYLNLDWVEWLQNSRPLVFDANNVLNKQIRQSLTVAGVRVRCIGRGV